MATVNPENLTDLQGQSKGWNSSYEQEIGESQI